MADSFPSRGLKGIRIVGFKGQLTLTADLKSDHVVTKSSSKDGTWGPHSEIKDGYLEIKVDGPQSKSDWHVKSIGESSLDIHSPALPVSIVWWQGDISLKNWEASTQITHQKGRIRIEDGGESLKISMHEGELDVLRHVGKIDIDNYDSKINLKKIDGVVRVDNFQGHFFLSDSKGDLSLKTVKGKNAIDGLRGTLEFDNTQGDVQIVQTEGSIRGTAEAGTVGVTIKGPLDVRVRSDDAKVSMTLHRNVGARVDLGTQEGSLVSGLPLKSEHIEKFKLLKGQISGNGDGFIFVRSRSGDLKIRAI